MEDFANILHRDYGLKPGGKSAPMAGGGAGHSRAGSSGGKVGRSGSAPRMANDDVFGSSVFNSAPGNGGGARSYSTRSSGALYNDVFGGAPTGVSSSSNDFGDLLGGFKTSGSRPQPSQNSFSDDLLGGYSASKPSQATAHASSSSLDDIFSGGLGQTRTSSHNSFSAKDYDDDPFSSFGMPKPEPKVTQSQTLFDDDWNFSASKPKPASRGSTLHASMDGDLLGGFSTSGGRSKQATPFRSPPSSPPRANHSEPVFDEFLPGFGGGDQGKKTALPDADAMRGIPIISTDDDDVFSSIPSSTSASTPDPFRGIPGTRSGGEGDASRGIPPVTPLDADEMRGIPPVSSSPIVDDDPFSSAAEVDPFANIIADSIPPPAASHADPLDSFDMPPASVPSSNGATEESGAQVSDGGGSPDPFDGFPHPSPLATPKAKEESTPSRSGSGSDGREGSQGSGTWDDKPSRRGFGSVPLNVDLNEVPDVASPTYPSGTYDGRTGRESHGFAPKFDDEPKFDEPSMPGDERSNSSRHDTDKVPIDIFEENWLTVDDLKLVTAPSATRPPSRAPPRPGFDKRRSSRRAASQRDSVGERSAGERSRGRSDELPVYKGSRPNGLDASKEDELARERAAAREREAALVQKERDAAERERAARQRDRAERAERQRERERQMDRLREQETPRNAEPARERVDTRNEVPNARDDEAAERAKKAAERAAKEAQHRMEKAAAERAIAEARERAERAARERAERVARERVTAAREKEQREKEQKEREEREKREREERAKRERAKEERERERERREREERERREKEDREKERERDRERDRRRERERGAAEQPRPTSASSRATSEPRQRPATNQPAPSGGDVRRPSPGNPVYSSTGSSPMPTPAPRNPQPSMKAVDDWTTLLTQTAPSGDEFQEIPGETAERRKLRMERHQKTIERAQQALKEKNDRDKALAMEQAERSRASGNLDAEIRRWATGKEGNLRALLSSLHLVLWPEANWKPLSLTDLITGISVKKAYQRAILCVHPDKSCHCMGQDVKTRRLRCWMVRVKAGHLRESLSVPPIFFSLLDKCNSSMTIEMSTICSGEHLEKTAVELAGSPRRNVGSQELACDAVEVYGVLHQPVADVRETDATTAQKELEIAVESLSHEELSYLAARSACMPVVQGPPLHNPNTCWPCLDRGYSLNSSLQRDTS